MNPEMIRRSEEAILQSIKNTFGKKLKVRKTEIPAFSELWKLTIKKHPEINRYGKERRQQFKSKVEEIYGLTLFQKIYPDLSKIKASPEIMEKKLIEKGISIEKARKISQIPEERMLMKGYVGELVAEALLKTAYGNKNVLGEAGDKYKQPKTYTKGVSGKYLAPDYSLNYTTPEGVTTTFFVEVKTTKMNNNRILSLSNKYVNKTIDPPKGTSNGPTKATKGIIVLLGNEKIDFKTVAEAYKKGVVIISKTEFSELMSYYNAEPTPFTRKRKYNLPEKALVSEEIKQNPELLEKYRELKLKKPKDTIKMIDRELKSVNQFVEALKTKLVSGKTINRENMPYIGTLKEERTRRIEEKIEKAFVPPPTTSKKNRRGRRR